MTALLYQQGSNTWLKCVCKRPVSRQFYTLTIFVLEAKGCSSSYHIFNWPRSSPQLGLVCKFVEHVNYRTRKLQNNQIKRMQNVYGEWGHLWTLSAHICSMVDLVWDAMKSVYFVEIRSVHTLWASLKFWFGKCSSPLSPVPAKAWHFQQITDTWGLIVLTFVWVQLSIFYSKSEGDQNTKVPGFDIW